MSWFDSQLKILIHFKYLIFGIPYTLYISVLVLSTMNILPPLFWGIKTSNLFFFCLKDTGKILYYFCHVCLYSFFKKYLFLNISSIYLILFLVKGL